MLTLSPWEFKVGLRPRAGLPLPGVTAVTAAHCSTGVFAFLPLAIVDGLLKLVQTPLRLVVQSHQHVLVMEGTSSLVLKWKRRKGKQEGMVE